MLMFVLSGNITARISRGLQVSEKRGLPFVVRIEEEGNGMRQRRNRFICGKGKMKVYSINRPLVGRVISAAMSVTLRHGRGINFKKGPAPPAGLHRK